jgi:hypothetical protein
MLFCITGNRVVTFVVHNQCRPKTRHIKFYFFKLEHVKMAVFWVVAPCNLVEIYQRFRCPRCLHHQGSSVHTALQPRRQLSSYSSPREPHILLRTCEVRAAGIAQSVQFLAMAWTTGDRFPTEVFDITPQITWGLRNLLSVGTFGSFLAVNWHTITSI